MSFISKKIFFVLALAVSALFNVATASSNRQFTPQERYIERYASLAVEEMYRSGVPASITLAQGLLESGNGLSELAVKGNNHFGIKCHNNWSGRKMYHDDDAARECFRKYDSPEESFRDHSDFLRYRDRYRFLFDLDVTDYKGWAYGLKKAGYATDPSYPAKLIRLIEEYHLYEFDMKPSGYRDPAYDQYGSDPYYDDDYYRPKKQKKTRRERQYEEMMSQTIPESPSKIEVVKKIEPGPKGEFRFSLSRQMYSMNGVPFVYSAKGESYASIARIFGLFQKEILKFNDIWHDVDVDMELPVGTLVYVQKKKNEAAKGLEKHVIESGDSMWQISQRYGVRMTKLYKLNGLNGSYIPREGDIIFLRNWR